jgi:carboxylesterase
MIDVILIHGLSGSAKDMQYISDAMSKEGYRVTNISLPGHGTKPQDLLKTKMNDWINAVELSINSSKNGVFIIGQSMGALLALHYTAIHQENIKGVVLLSPAIKLCGLLNRSIITFLYLWATFLPLPALYYTKSNGADIADPQAKKNYCAYNKIPLNALAEFERLRRMTIKKLHLITVPVLMIYSTGDHTVCNDSIEIIDKNIRSTIKRKTVLKGSFHVISVDIDKDRVVDAILEFLRFIVTGVK